MIKQTSYVNCIFRFAPEKPHLSLAQLSSRSALTLVNSDVVLNYPRVTMPHIIDIGGMTTRPARPLPTDLQKFMDSAPDGVILISFGSLVATISERTIQIMLTTLGGRKEKIIFKYAQLDNVPDNMLVMPWIPQNDILGHPKVKLFIMHGGNNGQFEAVYHGVPMLVLPVFAEQPANALRIKYKGYGEHLKMDDLEEETFLEMIEKIISTPSYKQKTTRAGQIFRSRTLTPRERACYWIEHVLEFGGDYLHSIALDLPWYKYLMVDVLVVMLVIVIIVIAIICTIIYCLCRFAKAGKLKHD